MYQYRIYVGCNVPSGGAYPPDVVEIVGLRSCPFDGCTVQHVKGTWKGVEEKTVVFEYIGGDTEDRRMVRAWAEKLKADFSQEAVLFTRCVIDSFFV